MKKPPVTLPPPLARLTARKHRINVGIAPRVWDAWVAYAATVEAPSVSDLATKALRAHLKRAGVDV